MDQILQVSISFIAGYAVGSLDSIKRLLSRGSLNSENFISAGSESFLKSRNEVDARSKKKVTIDESKFVTDVSTEGMESKSEQSLGTVVQSNDNISLATSRLAQLKKMKG